MEIDTGHWSLCSTNLINCLTIINWHSLSAHWTMQAFICYYEKLSKQFNESRNIQIFENRLAKTQGAFSFNAAMIFFVCICEMYI